MQEASPVQQAVSLLRRSDEAALITDLDGVIEYVNPAFERITGFESGRAIGCCPSILKSGRHSSEFYGGLWSTLRAGHEFHGVLINRRSDGALYHEEKTIRPLFDDGRITHFLSCGRDVSERVAAVERLAYTAMHDSLTDLPNRGLFLDRVGQAIAQARRSGEPFALVLTDLDGFKSINDSLGHLAGDAVLRAAAQRLRLCVRTVDTVARLGGDEFGILLPGVADAAAAALVLRKIVDAFAELPLRLEGGAAVALSLSMGASLWPADGSDEGALIAVADRAMYGAKRGGGRGFRIGPEEVASAVAPSLPILDVEAGLRVLTQHVPVQRRIVHLGDILFRAGDAFRNVYLLRCGSCKLLGVGADGREQLVSLLFKGDWLGFEGIAEGRYACDAVAIDTGEIWSIRYDTLLQAGARSPAVLALLHAAMSREIGRERDATAAHFTLPADAKVANFLYHLGRRLQRSGLRADPITLRVTRAEIGTHLGLTLESVSRALTRLVRENVIRFGESSRRELHIARLPALQEFVRRRDD